MTTAIGGNGTYTGRRFLDGGPRDHGCARVGAY
ncbi:hypothetical protein B0H03_10713 [Rathayibacter iranicus NCPPB 2253 = VKM Ac-1602]|uniref:Uncharacterized protein n=1 Tax=Rathayibacter iranicus NCPPB 2253 = VKM Ac-1602 TaxID=1328868 RepID=A0ABX5LBH3_9MICO|nr:hypothetical protein B0H03_10713 [Rathayibacter iranicus NCPPB 2253 = VKM Ac-1602]